jgi:uncharacterized protein
MKLEQSFAVNAPIDVVWRALNDLERVAPCLPGASITGHDDDGTYHGEFKVKLGPTTAAYRGTIRITDSDESTHTATLSAKGTDKRGQGGANATIVNRLEAVDGATRVNAVTDFSITGRLARFGRGGMIEDISNKLLHNFATCLATRLAEAPAAPPAETGADVAAGDTAPEQIVAAGTEPAAGAAGGDVAAGQAAPEETAAAAPAPVNATGGEVTAGDAAPEAADAPPGAPASTAPPAPSPADAVAASRPAATPGPAPSQAGPAQPPASEPLKVGGLFWSVLWERIKQLFGGGRKG